MISHISMLTVFFCCFNIILFVKKCALPPFPIPCQTRLMKEEEQTCPKIGLFVRLVVLTLRKVNNLWHLSGKTPGHCSLLSCSNMCTNLICVLHIALVCGYEEGCNALWLQFAEVNVFILYVAVCPKLVFRPSTTADWRTPCSYLTCGVNELVWCYIYFPAIIMCFSCLIFFTAVLHACHRFHLWHCCHCSTLMFSSKNFFSLSQWSGAYKSLLNFLLE